MQAFRAFFAARGLGSPLLSQTATTSLKTIQARMFCGSPVLNSSSMHVERSFPIPGASSSSSSQAPVPTRHELHFYSPIIASQAATFSSSTKHLQCKSETRHSSRTKVQTIRAQQSRLQNSKPKTPPTPRAEIRDSTFEQDESPCG